MTVLRSFLLMLASLTIANNVHATHPPSLPLSHASSGSVENKFVSYCTEGEEWRKYLPDKLRSGKGAPLHRVTIKSKSNPLNKVTVYLLGTSHVSRTSCEDAKLLMEYARPDVLFVELCSQRVGILLDPHMREEEDKQNARDNSNQSPHGMTPASQKMSVLFTRIQADYAKKLNVTIGGEFRAAFQSALSQHKRCWKEEYLCRRNERQRNLDIRPCAIILGDRPVRITLARAWESLKLFGKLKLVLCLLWSSIRQPSEKELKEWMESILNDRTGKNDLMTKAMEEMGKHFPTLKKVIIEERDDFMAAKLRQTAEMLTFAGDNDREKVIVAVVGAGHCSGMMEKLVLDNMNVGPEEVLQTLVETTKRKFNDDEEVTSLVTDVVQFDYEYALQNEVV